MSVQETIESIITASGLPMSILIVGIGSADFSAMERLDGDNKALIQDGRVAERDIVQVGGVAEGRWAGWHGAGGRGGRGGGCRIANGRCNR